MRAIQSWDRFRLLVLQLRHPGLSIDPTASTNLAAAEFTLAPGARLTIGPRVVAERRRGSLRFKVDAGSEISVGADTWLCTEVEGILLRAIDGGTLRLGHTGFMNGCMLTAKREVVVGDRSMLGPGTRVFDSDQHDLDPERPEVREPVRIGDFVWVASDVTVLRGVEIGSHCIVGARAVVTESLPPHSLAVGIPAKVVGKVGDRSQVSF